MLMQMMLLQMMMIKMMMKAPQMEARGAVAEVEDLRERGRRLS